MRRGGRRLRVVSSTSIVPIITLRGVGRRLGTSAENAHARLLLGRWTLLPILGRRASTISLLGRRSLLVIPAPSSTAVMLLLHSVLLRWRSSIRRLLVMLLLVRCISTFWRGVVPLSSLSTRRWRYTCFRRHADVQLYLVQSNNKGMNSLRWYRDVKSE
jgi:hypothetical protein